MNRLNSNPQCDSIRKWSLWEGARSWKWSPRGWDSCPHKRDPGELPCPSHPPRTQQEDAYETQSGRSSDTEPGCTFVLDFPVLWKCEKSMSVLYGILFIGKDPGAGKDRRQRWRTAEDETVGRHQRLSGHELGGNMKVTTKVCLFLLQNVFSINPDSNISIDTTLICAAILFSLFHYSSSLCFPRSIPSTHYSQSNMWHLPMKLASDFLLITGKITKILHLV